MRLIPALTLPLAAAFALTAATGAPAQDMTEAERTAFRAEVRAYLLENPEVLMEAIAILENRQRAAEAEADVALVRNNAAALYFDDRSYVGGNPDGGFTVVEFLDYRCGYCKRAHPEVAALLAGDADIRYIIKEYPILGEESVLASRFAVAVQLLAGDEAYYEVHNTLMEFQGEISETSLGRVSAAFGLDQAAVSEVMFSSEVTQILADNRELAQRLQITGTPSFVFEDQMLRGYVPLAQMEAIVAELRAADG